MKALTTRVGTYLTGDAVADAVLSYGLALARAQKVELVDVPFRGAGGEVSRVRFRLGWLVDVDSVTHGGDAEGELLDAGLVSELASRERELRPHGDGTFHADEAPRGIDGFDDY